jgi:regulator of replication initiation timing
MSMDIEQIYRVGYSAGLHGHKCYPLSKHIVNEAIEELEALREELAVMKAENLILSNNIESVLREELAESTYNHAYTESRLSQSKTELIDTLEELAALKAENDVMCTGYLATRNPLAQVKSEAIRDFADYMQDPEIDPHGFNERAVKLADDYANEIEGK